MYIKAVCEGLILDVFEKKDVVYIGDDPFAGNVRCGKNDNPFGVLASDGGVIYAMQPREGYQTVDLVEFSDSAEYARLRSELDANRIPENTEPEEPDSLDEEEAPGTPMSASEMRAQIMALQKKLDAVTEQNVMLTECLLEMSEVVYA